MEFSGFGVVIILIFYAVSALVLGLLWRLCKPWLWARWVIKTLAVIVLVLPYVDELYVSYRFKTLCKDAGLHIPEKLVVEGYLDDSFGHRLTMLDAEGMSGSRNPDREFRFYEFPSKTPPQIVHVEKVDGKWTGTLRDKPEARYAYRMVTQSLAAAYLIIGSENAVVDLTTGEKVAWWRSYVRYPGWVERQWLRFFGIQPTECPGIPSLTKLRSAFVPKK